MRIGVPKEIKVHEYRVGMTPASVREAVMHGHEVVVERDAAARQGFLDADYERAGARVVATADEVFAAADLIVKVKEPQPAEIARLRAGQTLFTYLHLAPDPDQAKGLMKAGVTAIAYETVTSARGGLPLARVVLFWFLVGLGVLAKGPITPFVAGTAAFGAAAARRHLQQPRTPPWRRAAAPRAQPRPRPQADGSAAPGAQPRPRPRADVAVGVSKAPPPSPKRPKRRQQRQRIRHKRRQRHLGGHGR